METQKTVIQVSKRGPYILKGDVTLTHPDGHEEDLKGVIALCRCGGSSKKPFCDGTHTNIGFQG